jgi:hypothetical protein
MWWFPDKPHMHFFECIPKIPVLNIAHFSQRLIREIATHSYIIIVLIDNELMCEEKVRLV